MGAVDLSQFARLLWGTVVHRPYVYAFFATYLVFAARLLRMRGCAAFTLTAYLIAFASEYSSTRNGFPFGIYTYNDEMRARELWISNVPFWDSLSFVFLSYFSWVLAASLKWRTALRTSLMEPSTAFLSGLLMMLLDVVIDPLALLGDRWFLGKVYFYPRGGAYFGVTLTNFAGWFLVGCAVPLAYQRLARLDALRFSRWRMPSARELRGVYWIYAAVFVFNLAITAWIGELRLLGASSVVAGLTLALCAPTLRRRLACIH
jgi:uncharacterized membrane protein